ncbi:MAG TPA: hypothetical protein VF720_09195 [Candidatus Eisenbacteria bacterium]
MAETDFRRVLDIVWDDAERTGFAGWDPYDGLNGKLFRSTPLFRIPVARQAWIQLVKRMPVNLRPLTFQKPEVLAKGVSLFAMGSWRLAGAAEARGDSGRAGTWRRRGGALLDRLVGLRSPGWDEICWGYPYDWQSRAFFQPRDCPNLICSVFGAMAFERRNDGGAAHAVPDEVSRFVMRALSRTEDEAGYITYTPTTNTRVHNVNMLGAALLARSAKRANDTKLAAFAAESMRFSVDRLLPNGSWPYGESPNQAWVDNFHTGYNLVALEDYRLTTDDSSMDAALEKAYHYWDRTFFRADGAPSYYDNSHYPIDIHCCAQAILTWLDLERLDPDAFAKARKTAEWTMHHMWNGRHFTFQRGSWWRNDVKQIRWGQAWMFWALSELVAAEARS